MGNEGRSEDPRCLGPEREEVCIRLEGDRHEIEPEAKSRSWVGDDLVDPVGREVFEIRAVQAVQEALV
jgi:hypothetical protein